MSIYTPGMSWPAIASEISKLRELGYDKATLDRVTSDLANLSADIPGDAFASMAGMFDRAVPASDRPAGYVVNYYPLGTSAGPAVTRESIAAEHARDVAYSDAHMIGRVTRNRCQNPDCRGCNKRADWRAAARYNASHNRAGESYAGPVTI